MHDEIRLPLAGLLLLCLASTLRAQNPTESPHDLVKDVVYNDSRNAGTSACGNTA